MEKNNKGRFLICIIALAISFLAIIISIIAFWSSCKMEYDSGNAIMSAFAIIVTILIGAVTVLIAWQVYNHYVAKDEVRKMVEEESHVLAEDIWNVLGSIISSENLLSFSQSDYIDFDAYMRGIETAKKCKNTSLQDHTIDEILGQFHHLYAECKGNGVMHILKGKRKEYEHLCTDIDHKYIEELRDYITNAVEIDIKDSE